MNPCVMIVPCVSEKSLQSFGSGSLAHSAERMREPDGASLLSWVVSTVRASTHVTCWPWVLR